MRFTWDPRKARANLAKHGVSFEEAVSAVLDPFALEAADLLDPARTIVLGMSGRRRVLFVVIIAFDEADIVRVLSARRASPVQRRKYEETP